MDIRDQSVAVTVIVTLTVPRPRYRFSESELLTVRKLRARSTCHEVCLGTSNFFGRRETESTATRARITGPGSGSVRDSFLGAFFTPATGEGMKKAPKKESET